MWDILLGKADPRQMIGSYQSNATRVDFMKEANLRLQHVDHCLGYLREAIMCAGDTSLEETTLTPDDIVDVSMNQLHTCRSWDYIWKYTEKHGTKPKTYLQ